MRRNRMQNVTDQQRSSTTSHHIWRCTGIIATSRAPCVEGVKQSKLAPAVSRLPWMLRSVSVVEVKECAPCLEFLTICSSMKALSPTP